MCHNIPVVGTHRHLPEFVLFRACTYEERIATLGVCVAAFQISTFNLSPVPVDFIVTSVRWRYIVDCLLLACLFGVSFVRCGQFNCLLVGWLVCLCTCLLACLLLPFVCCVLRAARRCLLCSAVACCCCSCVHCCFVYVADAAASAGCLLPSDDSVGFASAACCCLLHSGTRMQASTQPSYVAKSQASRWAPPAMQCPFDEFVSSNRCAQPPAACSFRQGGKAAPSG